MSLVIAGATVAAFADGPPYTLRVMTYNIGSASPAVPLGPAELAMIAEDIKNEQVDLVGMQEVDIDTERRDHRDLVAELADALAAIDYPMDHYAQPTGPSPEEPGSGYQVIWSRLPIVETSYVDFGVEYRKLSRVVIQLDEHLFVDFFTTHFATGELDVRQLQTDAWIAYANSFGGPRIFTGDFNLTPDTPLYSQIINAGFNDACVAVSGADCLTVGGAGNILSPPRLYQIDYIFGSPQVTFVDAYVPSRTLSDHWPIVAEAQIPAVPAICATPMTIERTVYWGRTPSDDTVQVDNCGVGQLQVNAAVQSGAMFGIPWIHATAPAEPSADGSGDVTIEYNSAALPPGVYNATVKLDDADAANSPVGIPVRLTVKSAPGDFDLDNDVDIKDFTLFQLCFNGADKPPGSGCSADADFDNDGDVDVADFAQFSLCFDGTNRLPACTE